LAIARLATAGGSVNHYVQSTRRPSSPLKPIIVVGLLTVIDQS